MSITETETAPSFTTIELQTPYGPDHRRVSTKLPRDSRSDEIPIIDISGIYDSADERVKLASQIKDAAENSGFFYVKNHGIDVAVINQALQASKRFFAQPVEEKQKIAKTRSHHYNGYNGRGTTKISPSESIDKREAFMWSYDPELDADVKDCTEIPETVKKWLRCEDFIWEGTAQVPNFKNDIITYWRACLKLARSLVKVFALCQGLPEDYFDALTTYPGADGVLNYYPGLTSDEASKPVTDEVGIGSHTDLQCFTLLWQDDIGGLQVLNNEDQWIKAKPIPGTLVVNIGDFLMRMSNDKFKSTVHRVFNRTTLDRYSMPFFFGFNFNEICSVLPTCIDEKHPAKYEPISCGEWCALRFQKVQLANKGRSTSQMNTQVSITV